MLDVSDVDDLVFERGHLVPGEAALRSREIEHINTGIDHPITEAQVFDKVGAGESLTRMGRAVAVPGNAADILPLIAMPGPRGKVLLPLLEVKMGVEERVVCNSPKWGGAVGGVIPQRVGTLLGASCNVSSAAWYWDLRADRTSMVHPRCSWDSSEYAPRPFS